MDVSLLIRQRLKELGLGQKDIADAAQVTESYISQLLARKKAPPAPGRTDIYEKICAVLKLPSSELAKLAELERKEWLRKKVAEPPRALFKECRELVLRKCAVARQKEVRRIFENQPFGELERLVTQKILDVAQAAAKDELQREEWLRQMAEGNGHSYEQLRVSILEFLDTDVFNISLENCVSFLDPMIESWDIDLKSFGMEVVPNSQLAAGRRKRFEFSEQESSPFAGGKSSALEPGLDQFLKDASLSGDATEDEVAFLKALKLGGKRPSPIYYYRELQNLRDPLHFPSAVHPAQSD